MYRWIPPSTPTLRINTDKDVKIITSCYIRLINNNDDEFIPLNLILEPYGRDGLAFFGNHAGGNHVRVREMIHPKELPEMYDSLFAKEYQLQHGKTLYNGHHADF